MLTLENMGPVIEAYRQDLRDMRRGTYTAPLPAPAMYDFGNCEETIQRRWKTRRRNAARRTAE